MSAPAFTPGPWSPRFHGEMDGTQMWFLHETGKIGLSACAENEADIRLIAAAPELYEAAETVFAGLNARIDAACASGGSVPVFDGIAALSDALAKARGDAL